MTRHVFVWLKRVGRANFTDMDESLKPNEYRALLAFVLGETREWVFLNMPLIRLTPTRQALLDSYVKRRVGGEPLAKIIGHKEFYGRDFFTNAHTLDPRPDSETLIDAVKYFYDGGHRLEILDLGIGTGCLLFTLLLEFPHALGLGIDKSFESLRVALKNRKALGLDNRALLSLNDWTRGIRTRTKFDVIVANPPYVPLGTVLDEETAFDPSGALFADENGMAAYKKILEGIREFLNPNGSLFLEIGRGQASDVDFLATAAGLRLEKTFRDLAGIDRVVCYRG